MFSATIYRSAVLDSRSEERRRGERGGACFGVLSTLALSTLAILAYLTHTRRPGRLGGGWGVCGLM